MIQKWFAIQSEALDTVLNDSISLRRFIGLPNHQTAPDNSALEFFRERIHQRQIDAFLFAEIDRQLDSHCPPQTKKNTNSDLEKHIEI
ncbi:MAG: transposase [Chlamydiia bacterium]|nr:transposase [Chlamydiia bacterium]